MFPFIYLGVFITVTIVIMAVLVITQYKKNSHTQLYNEGVRNENEGHYILAVHNFEDALNENKKLKLNKRFSAKISERIKILRITIDYEKNFQSVAKM